MNNVDEQYRWKYGLCELLEPIRFRNLDFPFKFRRDVEKKLLVESSTINAPERVGHQHFSLILWLNKVNSTGHANCFWNHCQKEKRIIFIAIDQTGLVKFEVKVVSLRFPSQIEPVVQEGNEGVVHHILLYQCDHNNFPSSNLSYEGVGDSPDMPPAVKSCTGPSTIAAWAIGGEVCVSLQNV